MDYRKSTPQLPQQFEYNTLEAPRKDLIRSSNKIKLKSLHSNAQKSMKCDSSDGQQPQDYNLEIITNQLQVRSTLQGQDSISSPHPLIEHKQYNKSKKQIQNKQNYQPQQTIKTKTNITQRKQNKQKKKRRKLQFDDQEKQNSQLPPLYLKSILSSQKQQQPANKFQDTAELFETPQQSNQVRKKSEINTAPQRKIKLSLRKQITKGNLKANVTRIKGFFGGTKELQISFTRNQQVKIKCQRINWGIGNSQYKLTSIQKDNHTEQGFLISNFNGSKYNFYVERSVENGTGLTSKFAPDNKTMILATIIYKKSQSLLKVSKYRQMQVYIRKTDIFQPIKSQFDEDNQLRDLAELYQMQCNKDKIIKLISKKPLWNQKKNCYVLDFYGICKMQSVHNFILYDQNNPNVQSLILGKNQLNTYKLCISNPLSIRVGICIALSSLDFKWVCQ